jgi:hypothetical protein
LLSAWKKYEEKAAEFFISLGLKATVGKEVPGVRGSHEVDVFVEGSLYGIEFKWVVECKAWKSNVPKEKVMALISIVQDIGADRGFLLSEKGFQSGAIRAVNNTNITLTSINDLQSTVEEELVGETLGKLSWRLNRVTERLRIIKRKSEDWFPPALREIGGISLIDAALADAANGIYPNPYKKISGELHSADSFAELVIGVDALLCDAEAWADAYEADELLQQQGKPDSAT